MKKIFIYALIIATFVSCEKILDDKKELNAIDNIWEDADLVNLFLNQIYQTTLPGFGGSSNTSLSDESVGYGESFMMFGLLTKDASYGNFSGNSWTNIRKINILLDQLGQGSLDEETVKEIKGQALFLRAWSNWELVKYYGGIPIILDVIDPTDYENYSVKRSSAKKCIEQIISDLDLAIEYLPAQWLDDEKGRITRGAAAALKGRVLLFYASPQFNPDYDQQRWQDAYDANLDALEMCEEDGYELFDNFESIFLDETNSKEGIFITIYDIQNKSHGYEEDVRPRSVSNSNSDVNSVPNWDFVKSFPMKDGFPIEGHVDYDSVYFWKNRDPRFYATVAYNGMSWDFEGEDDNRIQWTYLGTELEDQASASITGFYLKKNINTSIPKVESDDTPTDWLEIRLAEVYLNLAESAAELIDLNTSHLNEAKDLLIALRNRAGIEEGDGSYGITASTKDEMIEAVMLERKIELAFENKRHWDLRRRNLFINDLHNTPKINGSRRHGIEIVLDTLFIKSLNPAITDENLVSYFENIIMDTADLNIYYDDFFKTNIIEIDPTDINFLQPEYNFYFIPDKELETNKNMKQTIYWTEIDPFDPLSD